MTTRRIDLPFLPRLNPNVRMHWAKKARLVKDTRTTTAWLVKAARVPAVEHVTVELHYQPGCNRTRDAINLTLDQKACGDGVVDAGVVPDDNGEFMTTPTPILHPPATGERGRMWLEIHWKKEIR